MKTLAILLLNSFLLTSCGNKTENKLHDVANVLGTYAVEKSPYSITFTESNRIEYHMSVLCGGDLAELDYYIDLKWNNDKTKAETVARLYPKQGHRNYVWMTIVPSNNYSHLEITMQIPNPYPQSGSRLETFQLKRVD